MGVDAEVAVELLPGALRAIVSGAACGDSVVPKFKYGSETTMWGAQRLDGCHVGSPTVPVERLGVVRASEIDDRRCSAERPAGVLRARLCCG